MSRDKSSPERKKCSFRPSLQLTIRLIANGSVFIFAIGADSAPNTYRGSSRLKRDCKEQTLCDLETISYPRTVLIKGGGYATHPQLVPASGEGQNPCNKSSSGAEADRQSKQMATGPVRHIIERARSYAAWVLSPLPMSTVLAPVTVPVRPQADPPPSYLKNFSWSNGSLFFSIK